MTFKQLWHKASFIGLSDDQEFSHREVVLLNKLVVVGCIVFLPIIPIEVVMNGWKLVPYELLMFATSALTLVFTYKKLFTLAKIYFFFMMVAFIYFLGIGVGYGSGNELTLIAVFIAPAMLFKNMKMIITFSVIALAAFIGLKYVQDAIPPFMDVPVKLREEFQIIFKTFIPVIIFFQIYYFKNINLRFQDLLKGKNEEIAEKNKEIVDSINYAQRIQDAYLPPKNVLSSTFPESFLLFEPKDIVSGDFYWFYTPKVDDVHQDISFVIAADCTGHGVPGAIMSVICCNALNEVIVNGKEYDTGKILDKVRNQIVSILRTKGTDSRKDGMDVALVKVNRSTKEVQFSGAHNPLWILKKHGTDIEQIKADKQPVGAFENAQPFTSHTIQLAEGDTLYMFSDGYQDQFGGDKGKKFKAANLKQLILDNKNQNMEQQHQVLKTAFHDWKGDLEQVDDVVLIGLKL